MNYEGCFWSSLVAQQTKELALSLLCPRSLLWHGFCPWPRNFCILRGQSKKKKIEKLGIHSFFFLIVAKYV